MATRSPSGRASSPSNKRGPGRWLSGAFAFFPHLLPGIRGDHVADVIPFEKRRKPAKAASAPSDTTVLDDAIAKICAIELKIKAADGSKCLHALDAGDLLKPINATIAHGKWLPVFDHSKCFTPFWAVETT